MYKKFIKVGKYLGNLNLGLSMKEFSDLYTIYAMTCPQAVASKTNKLTYTITGRLVLDQNNQTSQNPRNIDASVVIISEFKLQINGLINVTRKI